ncbi:nucleotidyl transferase AbiEii/AbiGii toxin family protein [Noviherbaspirillum saxi]|uniref:nucleotidyl transferase AbiEii/AbiGii toxin family protein n=1 Tax=Noviherbaspirillum saxi TaxID=2320863 RepID=UPI003082C66C
MVLTRYAIERLLYRISISNHADQFLLKGALLFDLWFDIPHRPTRDADFLGFGSAELPHIEGIFKEICTLATHDGVTFQPGTVHAAEIRKEANYAGVRVMLLGTIDSARCQIQIDIGFGDAVTPGPEDVEYPVMLSEFEAPKLRVYSRYTVVAEKFEALSSLGIANSRMKDYFDLWILALHTDFDGDILRQAVQATFDRRKTTLTGQVPFGLTDTFAQDPQKQTQWQAFLRKNRLEALALNEVIAALAAFMLPVIEGASANTAFPAQWHAGGPWSPAEAG